MTANIILSMFSPALSCASWRAIGPASLVRESPADIGSARGTAFWQSVAWSGSLSKARAAILRNGTPKEIGRGFPHAGRGWIVAQAAKVKPNRPIPEGFVTMGRLVSAGCGV
jgi:hypothetical protein